MGSEASNFDALESICNSVKEEYGFNVYASKIEQGFKEPCFFVETISTNQQKIGFNRYKRTQSFCIHYFPKDNKLPIRECLQVAENLSFALESIKINGNSCRGTLMKHNTSGEVLHFYVNYNYHLILKEDHPVMEELNQSGGLKSGR